MSVWSRWLSGRTRRTSSYARPNCIRLESRETPAYAGGVTVASGDFNNDGKLDILVGNGSGREGPNVRVYSGADGSVLTSFDAYARRFSGGVFVAAGDIDGDGFDDIITGAGKGGDAHVRVISGLTGQSLFEQNVFPGLSGGVRVASGDVNGDGRDDLIVAAGPGGAPEVRVFDGKTLTLISSFQAYEGGFSGGVFVAAGDIDGDGTAEIITGAGAGRAPQVNTFNVVGQLKSSFLAYDPNFTGGVSVAAVDVAGSGGTRKDIVTGAGAGGTAHIQVFSGFNGEVVRSFLAYDPKFAGGVFVSGGNYTGDATGDILTGAGAGGSPHVIVYNGSDLSLVSSFYAFDTNAKPGNFGQTIDTSPPDSNAPSVTIDSPSSGLVTRTNVTVSGTATDDTSGSGIASVQYQLDSSPFVTIPVSSGTYSFTTTFNTNGTQDGTHTIRVQSLDKKGNVSAASAISIVLDTTVVTPDFTLTDATDSGSKGDYQTSINPITITGTTEANVTVKLSTGNASTTADGSGKFTFSGIQLNPGANTLTVTATDGLGNVSQAVHTVTLDQAPTVSKAFTDVTVPTNTTGSTTLNLTSNFTDPDVSNSTVKISTNLGDLNIRLFDQQTPLNVNNFFSYLNSGRYTDTIIHRVVSNFVDQGGGFKFTNSGSGTTLDSVITDPAVADEIGISNKRGTLAFAKPSDSQTGTPIPNSATSQFFVNQADNTFLDPNFSVFGELADTASQTTADKINAITTSKQASPFNEIPLINYTGSNFPTDTTRANYVIINSVATTFRSDQLTFSVTSNSNASLVTAAIVGNKLTLSYAPNASGTADITLRATDRDGAFVESVQHVTVTAAGGSDTTAPTLTTSPANGSTTTGNVNVTGTATDEAGGSGITTIEARFDGAAYSTIAFNTTSNTFSFNTTFDPNTSANHTVDVRTTDGAGNVSAVSSFTVVINPAADTTPPTVSLTAPVAGTTSNSNVTVTGSAVDDAGGSGVTKVEAQFDGGSFATVTFNAADGSFSFPTAFGTDGSHTIGVRATDTTGNTGGVATTSFTLDTATPAPDFALAPASDSGTQGDFITNQQTVTINGTGEPNSTATLSFNGATTTIDGSGAYSFGNVVLNMGSNTVTVFSTDPVGNTNNASHTITFDPSA